LREECRLRVLENKLLRRVFGPKRDNGAGEWRRYTKRRFVLLTKYNLGNQIKKTEMDRAYSTYGEQ
jgi:hypothetical protein